jgi:hypothetical protein
MEFSLVDSGNTLLVGEEINSSHIRVVVDSTK